MTFFPSKIKIHAIEGKWFNVLLFYLCILFTLFSLNFYIYFSIFLHVGEECFKRRKVPCTLSFPQASIPCRRGEAVEFELWGLSGLDMAAAVRAGGAHRGVISVTRRGSHSSTALKPQYDAVIIGAGRLQTYMHGLKKQNKVVTWLGGAFLRL